jgi:hypothetical protein
MAIQPLDIIIRLKDEVTNKIKGVREGIKSFTTDLTSLSSIITGTVVGIGFKSLFDAYEEAEVAQTKLSGALRSQGKYSKELTDAFIKNASALQDLTICNDEAILSGQAFAMNMGVSADTVSKITPTILDFASAMNVDLQTAFQVVGQAAMGNTSQLRRYGIIVDESKLKNEGFNAVLETMQKNFAGSSESIAKTTSGSMSQFRNTLDDLFEEMGQGLAFYVKPLSEGINILLKSVMGTNTKTAEFASIQKRLKSALDEGNLSVRDRNFLLDANKQGQEELIKKFLDSHEKEKAAFKEKIELSEEWARKIKETREKEAEEENKKVKAEAKEIEERYDFRRELRELDLQEVIDSLEKEYESTETSAEDKKAILMALEDYKKEAQIQSAVETEKWNDKISDLFVGGIKDWESAWKGFQDYIVNFILKTIADEIVKSLMLGEALKKVLGGFAGGGGILGFVGSLFHFQSGGTLNEPVVGVGRSGQMYSFAEHGAETFAPLGSSGGGMGGGVNIGSINIQFPNVTTFSDWMAAPPSLVKEVTEKKIFEAFRSLAREGKMTEVTKV